MLPSARVAHLNPRGEPSSLLPCALRLLSIVGGGAAALALILPANAQSLPSEARPRSLEELIRSRPAAPKPQPEVAVSLEPPNNVRESPAANAESFFVSKVRVDGAKTVETEVLLEQVRHLEGRKITLDEALAAVDRITRWYRGQGFVLSRAVVPPQDVSSGVLTLQVIEATIGTVRLQGLSEDQRLLGAGARTLEQGSPFHLPRLEAHLLLLNRLPGIEVRSVIEPSADRKSVV